MLFAYSQQLKRSGKNNLELLFFIAGELADGVSSTNIMDVSKSQPCCSQSHRCEVLSEVVLAGEIHRNADSDSSLISRVEERHNYKNIISEHLYALQKAVPKVRACPYPYPVRGHSFPGGRTLPLCYTVLTTIM